MATGLAEDCTPFPATDAMTICKQGLPIVACHDGPHTTSFCAIVTAAGGYCVDSWNSAVTHTVVLCEPQLMAINKSVRFIMGIAAGTWVVSDAWKEACIAAKQIVPCEPFEVIALDGCGETFHYGPRRSREARERGEPRLFTGYKFFCALNKQDVLYTPALVLAAGGELLPSLSALVEAAHGVDPERTILLGEFRFCGCDLCSS